MSTAIIHVTSKVRRVTSDDVVDNLITAPANEVVEVLGFRAMRLTLKVWELKVSTGNPNFVLAMETGMSPDDPDGFVSLGVFDPIGGANVDLRAMQRVFTDLQRFVRWRIIMFANLDSAQFSIEGVAYE